jgi:hypothetical protein
MLRLLADENLDHDLVRGVLRRRSHLDLVRVQDVGLSETDDPDILAWAAREQRVVLTHDVNTMSKSYLAKPPSLRRGTGAPFSERAGRCCPRPPAHHNTAFSSAGRSDWLV